MTNMPVGIEITRVFDAPREAVWEEWTDPEPFADWFGGAESEVRCRRSRWTCGRGPWRLTMLAGPERREIR